jgi:uncharacterized membrane protein YraQ (UPF0718 family)
MNELQANATLVALFALRCVAPLVITVLIGYLMNRMVDRWEAEDALISQGEQPETVSVPRQEKNLSLPTVTVPCWLVRNCEPAERSGCPAHQQPGIPCWLARLRADGRIPPACPSCPIYARAMAPVPLS